MPFRFLFKTTEEQRFHEGTFFDDEKEAIAAVMNAEDLHPEEHFGYIEIADEEEACL